MSRTSVLGAALYETEASWGEDVATYTNRIPILGTVDASGLTQEKVDADRTTQYAGERTMPIRGVKGGSFSIRVHLAGHGSSTAGSGLSMSTVGTLLGNVIGNGAMVASAGTTLTGSTDADTWAATASDTFTDGGVCFLGAIGDGDGEGEAFLIETHTSTAIQVENAAAGAPVNGAVLYSAENIYPSEQPSTMAVTSTRWLLQTANQQYACHGCFPQSITFDLPFGGLPTATITYGVSWWEEASETFPSTASVDEFAPAPIAAGTFFYQTFDTRTRATVVIRSMTINLNLGITPVPGPGGVDTYQNIVGAVRGKYEMTLEWTEDAPTASTSPTRPGEWDADTTYKHAVWTLNRGAASGRKVAFAFRKLYLDGVRPVQTAIDGINRYTVRAHVCAHTSGSGDIARAGFILAMG